VLEGLCRTIDHRRRLLWGSVGGHYRHIYTANIQPKKENYMFLHTYTLLLTYFHLYPSIHCPAGNHTKYEWNTQEICFSRKCIWQEEGRSPTIDTNLG
jgi:hypothetical protein